MISLAQRRTSKSLHVEPSPLFAHEKYKNSLTVRRDHKNKQRKYEAVWMDGRL